LVSPAEFVPLAEETGLISDIGDWVFEESLKWARRWSEHFSPDFQVSVNVSPIQFHGEGRFSRGQWAARIEEEGLASHAIAIEITEGVLLDADVSVTDRLLDLRDHGIQVAIDDFGTGYSSLAYLKRLDIDYLKIDRTFVRDLSTDPNDRILAEAMIALAHKLDLKVIAEGVETEQQRDLLAAAGCDYVQGYLYSRPLEPRTFEEFLARRGG
jgi:EAL domain-containing protein (putative c-di-GMP-specific phosphodiesterase class I)